MRSLSRPGSIERFNVTVPEQSADSSSLNLTAERTDVDEEQPVYHMETPQRTNERLGPPSSIALSPIPSETQLELSNGSSTLWKAHQQDFYASKWFKSLHMFIIALIFSIACLLFTYLGLGVDIFDNVYIVLPVIFSLFTGAIVFLPIGIFGSRVFR